MSAVARPLFKVAHAMSDSQRITSLESRLRTERRLRREAEANARRFHALLLAERIKHLPTNGGGL